MASGLFSSIQSLSTKLLEAIRGTPSTSHHHNPPVTDQHKSVREDLEKLSRTLARIQAVQQDAEEREIRDRSVCLWLAELRGVGYQAEDVLDEFYYEVLRSIVESGDAAIEAYHRDGHGGTKRKFAEMYTTSSLDSYSFTTKISIPDGMAQKIKDITERFEEISNARRDLHLRDEDGTRLVICPQIRPPTSSHVNEMAIFGREEEKKKIISLLNPSNSPDFMVLPIVGMGGFGKTTLAQLVFNDSRIHELFNERCWISVSEDFDVVRLTKAIIDSLSQKPCEFSELNKLQDVLKEKIKGRGLFLVLDDVWNERRNLWECFRDGLCGAKFVRILTTTRNTLVAKIMQTTSHFQLSSLPEVYCWSLFKHYAFGNKETSENANLHDIGRGIVRKCKGSPLAIKAIGGILHYEIDEEKWREILESDISEIDETGEIMPALRLSYQKLPQHLKPCFLYLSMFPKDTSFEKDMVIRLWMAQGYINGNTRNLKTLEEIGGEYFDELQGRSLVDRVYTGYLLHDLIHDLARYIHQEECRPVLENDQQCNGSCKVYHLYVTKQDEFLSSLLAPNNYWSVRTFVKHYPRSRNIELAIFSKIACVRALHWSNSLLPNTLGTLKHLHYLSVHVQDSEMETLPETLCLFYNLQTLDLNIFHLRELPENIKNLINLRYFQLTSREIQQLPESIFLLRYLHTLSLRNCTKLNELPRGIEQLNRLRILDLPKSLIYIPSGIGKLKTLKTLIGDISVMDNDMTGGLRELKYMNNLSGLLCIAGLQNISDVEHSRNASLASKPNLHKLILNFQEDRRMMNCSDKLHLHLTVRSSNNAKNDNDEKMQDVVLQSLQPHGNLTELAIVNYGGRIFPSWLLNPLLPKLTSLTLNFCTEPNFLPPFGQLRHLRFLKISGSTDVRNVGDELSTYSLLAEYGSSKQPKEPSYPSLEVLSLQNMLNFVEWWAHDGDFPCLKKLVIENCPKLWKIATIPQEVTFKYCPKLAFLTCPSLIKTLEIHECGFREIMFGSISENLTISNCVELISINWSDGGLNSVREVSFKYCPKLELITIPIRIFKLSIHECGIREIIFQSVPENLTISNCVELISINWSDGGLNSVREVSFRYCPKLELITIPIRIFKLSIHECGIREIIFQSVHENLTISNCVELILINWSDGGLNSVREVSFRYCPKLELITIPIRILKLSIHECGIREIILHSVSENLTISNCVELISLNWMDGSFDSIRNVSIKYCPKLELQFPVNDALQHSMIQRAEIYDFHRVNLRDTMLKGLNLFGNKEICLSSVNSTIPFQESSISRTTSFEVSFQHTMLFLATEEFQEAESITCATSVGVSFQHIMLNLVSLVRLDIFGCTKVISVIGLDNLSNLKRLTISCCLELCNWNDKTLPLSLESLELGYCGKLSSLPLLSVQNHSSTLKVLVIKNCPRLAVLEGFHGLMKLNFVTLLHCRNISISRDTKSLQFMPRITNVGDCPLIRDWCQRNRITYKELNPIDIHQDDRESEPESAG